MNTYRRLKEIYRNHENFVDCTDKKLYERPSSSKKWYARIVGNDYGLKSFEIYKYENKFGQQKYLFLNSQYKHDL